MVRVKLIKLNVVDSAKLHTHTHSRDTTNTTDRRHDDKQQITPQNTSSFSLTRFNHLIRIVEMMAVEFLIYRTSLDFQLTLIGDFHFLITSFVTESGFV
jgi:hypothetical protein